jgi:hypothetical protein
MLVTCIQEISLQISTAIPAILLEEYMISKNIVLGIDSVCEGF